MVSSLYAGLLALLIIWLSFNVIKLRRAKKIRLGDGNDPEIQAAIRAQGNATEYIPIALVLLALLEFNHVHVMLLHLAGIALCIGRFLHAQGLLSNNLKLRVFGMQLTIFTIVPLALINIGYALSTGLNGL